MDFLTAYSIYPGSYLLEGLEPEYISYPTLVAITISLTPSPKALLRID